MRKVEIFPTRNCEAGYGPAVTGKATPGFLGKTDLIWLEEVQDRWKWQKVDLTPNKPDGIKHGGKIERQEG